MSSPCQRSSTPTSPLLERADSVTPPEYKIAKPSSMMKIQSLLNPSAMGNAPNTNSTSSPPLKPAYTVAESTALSTPQSTTMNSKSAGENHRPIKSHGSKNKVNYPPFEIGDSHIYLSEADKTELLRKYKQFKIRVPGKDASAHIADHTRHVPYSSDKKDFLEKTGRDGFHSK